MFRYILRREERKHITVSKRTHLLISLYARKHDTTLAEATWRLLRRSFLSEMGQDPDNKIQIEP